MATPVVAPTVATPAFELDHVPPEVAFVLVIVLPTNTVVGPPIAEGVAFTVKDIVAVDVPTLYDMVTTPALIPVTIPVVRPTVAIAVLLLLHVPPVAALVSVRLLPTHTLGVPVMGVIPPAVTVITL